MNTAGSDASHPEAEQIEALAGVLLDRGFEVEASVVEDAPALRIGTSVASLSETIYAAPYGGALWWWWSWGDPITPLADVNIAATRVARVLVIRS
jgi:hypothetical protein